MGVLLPKNETCNLSIQKQHHRSLCLEKPIHLFAAKLFFAIISDNKAENQCFLLFLIYLFHSFISQMNNKFASLCFWIINTYT